MKVFISNNYLFWNARQLFTYVGFSRTHKLQSEKCAEIYFTKIGTSENETVASAGERTNPRKPVRVVYLT